LKRDSCIAGQRPDPNTGARAVPIYQTTSYVFEDPESAAAYFNLQEYGNTYSRIMNPTVAVFEERIANLEGGCGAVAFASGIAAQAAALFTLLQPGDHVVSSSALYGGTVNQFKHLLRKMSVDLTWVNPDDPNAWKAAVRENTKAFYGETIGNPGGNVLDIATIATIAHDHSCRSSSTIHSPRYSAAPWNGAPTSSSTRRPNSSAVTERASAAWSWTRVSSTGPTDDFR
jgi:O-acetylhomoserine (thiol)-lyase